MPNFKPNLLTLAIMASGLSFIGSSALAQDQIDNEESKEQAQANQEQIEVISVSGIRSSLAKSQAIKMDNAQIVEAISAEDIGKLPDSSIAESISRLPGITAQRLDGRANVISIRGLAPDFTTATLNGREQVTVGDNRGVEFDQYPSELLSGVVVYKTPDAKLLAQAIGGTVDLQTIRPLAHGKQSFNIGARYEKNDKGALVSGSDDTGYRINGSYIDQFLDDTLGVTLGFASMSSPNQEERWNAWGYPNLNYDDANPLVLGGAKPFVRSSTLDRNSVMGSIEYQPTATFHTILDVFYSDFTDKQELKGIEIPGQWGVGWAVDSVDAFEAENGLVTSGRFNQMMGVMRNDVNKRDSDVTSIGWNSEYVVNSNWTIEADLSYSKTNRTDFGLESYSGSGRGNGVGLADDIGFEMKSGAGAVFSPQLDYSDTSIFKIGGPLSWGNGNTVPSDGQDGFINKPEIEDELKAVRLEAEYFVDSSFITSIEFGVNYSEREKSKKDNGYYLTLKVYDEMLAVPDEYLQKPTSLGFIGMGDMLTYNSLKFYKDGYYTETSENLTALGRTTGNWTVNEDVTVSYIQANLDTMVFGFPMTGNVGLQVNYTDQSSHGFAGTTNENGIVEKVSTNGGKSYTEWLPSMNLTFEVADSQYLRVGAARTLARARMDQMNASYNFNYDSSLADSPDLDRSPWSGGGGNPDLEPLIANQFDLSYEYYFDDLGYVSLAGFYKDLDNYIFDQTIVQDFSDVVVPDPQPVLTEGYITAPANGKGGDITGVELTVSIQGKMIADMLDGFGATVSGSLVTSSVKETSDSPTINLPGLSKRVLNTTVYYENAGFQARISSRYRSKFLGEVTGLSLVRDKQFVDKELVVDAQLGYNFGEAGFDSLDGLSVLFQVNNLTDEPFQTFLNGDTRQVRDYQEYGRTYLFGVNYNF